MAQAPGLGLLTTDRELIVRSWNDWLVSATGLRDAQVVGRSLIELLPPDKQPLYAEILADVLDKGAPRVLAPAFHHYLFPCPPPVPSNHFEQMQQRVTIAPLRTDAAVAGVMVTLEDMTAALEQQRDLAARMQASDGTPSRDALAAIGAEDWRVRDVAVRTLEQSASREDVAHLLAALERDHQNLDLLSSALRVLIAANRDVVPPLIALLSDPHANLRMHAALALGQLGAAEAVPALVATLDDEDANVRFHAIEALGHLAAPAAVDSLTRIAESGDFFLAFPAIDALARTDDPRVAPSLIGLLENEHLRPAVVDTLAALGDEECVPPLVALLDAGKGDAGPVAAALDQIRERYERTFAAGEHIVELTRSSIGSGGIRHLAAAIDRRERPLASLVNVIGWTGDVAAAVLVTLISDPAVQTEVVDRLAAIGRPAIPSLLEALTTGDRLARLAIAGLLGRIGDRCAVPVLIGLLSEADADLVTTAAAALASLGDPMPLAALLPLFGHERPAVRHAAVAAVNAIGAGTAELYVRERLEDPNPHVRECAIRVAGYFGFESCVPHILGALEDGHEDVRRAAIEQLSVLDHPQAPRRLAAALSGDSPRNRAAAAHAARAADDPSLDLALIDALSDADPWVRYFAAGSLSQRRTRGAVGELSRVAAADPAPQVRIAAMQAVGELDPGAAIPLAEQLVQEKDDDIACAALSAIARAQDPRVDALLENGIRSTSAPIRSCAIVALKSRPTAAAVEGLGWAARMTDLPGLAASAVDALASLADAEQDDVGRAAVAALIDVAVEPGRRAEVIDALSRLSGRAIDDVASALGDQRASARLMAVEALARMRHPRASSALTLALRDRDPSVRAAAVLSFGRLGTPAVAATIAEMRETDEDPLVRYRAGVVCHRYGWGE